MSYDLVTFNVCRKLILHNLVKCYTIVMTTILSIVSLILSLLGEKPFLESIFSATLRQFGGVPPT